MLNRFSGKDKIVNTDPVRTMNTDNIRVCKSVKDFSKEEYFVKKAEAARQAIKEWGLPKELMMGKR